MLYSIYLVNILLHSICYVNSIIIKPYDGDTKTDAIAQQNQTATSEIVRPCVFNDVKCVRDNLVANSKCNANVKNSVPAMYTLNNFVFEAPSFNSTYIENYVTIRNHDRCVVIEFFFDTVTDSGVLGLDCPWLDFEANRTMIQHRPLQLDGIFSYWSRGTYPLIRLTTHFRNANDIDLCSSHTSVYIFELPKFFINPNDKPTANFLSRDLSDLKIFERENMFSRAKSLFRTFVNSKICDFGCNN